MRRRLDRATCSRTAPGSASSCSRRPATPRGSRNCTRIVAARAGLPLVAAGDVHMHVRARRALQDTLTAIRLRTPLAECGHALYPNGERHLRSRARLAGSIRPSCSPKRWRSPQRCHFSLDELRYEYPEEIVPPDETPASWLRKLAEAGCAERWPRRRASPKVRELIEHELALIAELRLRAVLPHRARHRRVRALARTSCARAAARRPIRRSATPRHHRGRPGAHATCCSSASSARSATSRRTSTSTSSTSGARR